MKRVIVDYAKLTNEILNLLVEKFPDGYDDSDVIRFRNAKNELIEAVEVRTEDTIYLVKISTKLADRIENYDEDDDIDLDVDTIEPVKGLDLDDDADDDDDAVTIIEPETQPSTIGRPYSKGKSTEKPSPESVVSLSRPKPSRGEPSIGDLKPLIQAHEDELLSENILPSPASESISASPSRDEIACYLVYEPGSSGKLILHYSETSLDHAIGKWVPGPGKKIQGFKVTQNSGRSDLIGNCAGGVSGRKNYCSGWCQFVRSAKALNGTLTLLEETGTGLPVDVYFYFNGSNIIA